MAKQLDQSQPFECTCGATIYSRSLSKIKRHEETTRHILITCVHHWQIQVANGPISSGSCAKCGSVKEFSNSIESYGTWSDSMERKKRQSEEIQDELAKTFT